MNNVLHIVRRQINKKQKTTLHKCLFREHGPPSMRLARHLTVPRFRCKQPIFLVGQNHTFFVLARNGCDGPWSYDVGHTRSRVPPLLSLQTPTLPPSLSVRHQTYTDCLAYYRTCFRFCLFPGHIFICVWYADPWCPQVSVQLIYRTYPVRTKPVHTYAYFNDVPFFWGVRISLDLTVTFVSSFSILTNSSS